MLLGIALTLETLSDYTTWSQPLLRGQESQITETDANAVGQQGLSLSVKDI